MTKPIERERLLGVVQAHLKESAGARRATASSGPTPPGVRAAEGATGEAGSGRLRSTLGGGRPGNEVVAGFIGRLPQRVSALLTLMEQENLEELRRLVHQLKGAGAGYGFRSITDYAKRAEERIKAGAALEAVQEEVQALVELIRSVEGYERGREDALTGHRTGR